jgi:Lon-like ATP-dependent protease
MDTGDHVFARPSRITARVGLGREGVVNVEREVDLSGPTHSKGVLTLAGYLLGMYGQDQPLTLSARLAFEQVYAGVDGDSASSTELYALLSALADLPLRQDVAVTGSVNQRGEIQAVGEVSRKVEGFFAVCRARGLAGQQGVAIPAANLRHLMLKPEVVEAVAQGAFHIWPLRTVDEGLALLTGVAAGERGADGAFPAETVHGRVRQRLAALTSRLLKLSTPPDTVAPHRLPSAAGNGRVRTDRPGGGRRRRRLAPRQTPPAAPRTGRSVLEAG